jgi:FkbM family methyltransferase
MTVAQETHPLLDDLEQLLQVYAPIDPSNRVSPVDAFFAYRLLLGRHPDQHTELPALLNDPRTFREFLNDLLSSPEFGKTAGLFPPGQFLMAEVEGFRFWFNTSDREMGVTMALGRYEPATVELVKRLVKPGMRCLDVGAQTGFFTCLIASRLSSAGHLYAFEPMPPSYELLTRNVHENGFDEKVSTYPNACSNVATTIEASQVSGMYVVGKVDRATPVQTQSVRIDDVIDEPVDLIKIDIEGHEPAAIEGMAGLLRRSRPIIISEANEYWLRTCSHSTSAEYVRLLNSLNFTVYDVERLDAPLDAGDLALDILDTINVLALPSEISPASLFSRDVYRRG